MRACNMQIVKGGEIFCSGNDQPCDDGRPSKTEKNLLIGCGDCDEPEDGTTWRGAVV